MHIPEPTLFLDQVEAVAEAGAAELQRFWRSLEPDQVVEKARNDLVSAADEAAEQAILAAISKRFPEHSVLCEESGWSRSDADQPLWIVDPLDGTTNFVHGMAHFAVSIGVAIGGRVDYGVIIDPIKRDRFRAARGHGMWWNGEPCSCSARDGLAGALIATGFPFKAHRLLDRYLAIFREVFLRCKAIRRPGSAALDLAYTACGIFDGFFEFQLSPWDIAAGSIMIEEAGGVISDMDGGPEFLDSGDVICGPPAVHGALLDIVRE